jgi:MFS family permease
LVPLCLASLLWAFSFGLSAPLASLVLEDAGHSTVVIGNNTGTYYLGIALAAVFVPVAMSRWGYRALLVGMTVSGLTVIPFAWTDSLTVWFLLRALNGVAGALSLIPLESYVNHTSTPAQRAENFGYYAFCIALGIGLGNLLAMLLHTPAVQLAFLLGGLSAIAAALVVAFWRPTFPPCQERHERTPLAIRRNFLSYGSAWCQGFMEGAMIGLLPIYLGKSVGLTDNGIGCLMGGLMVAVILFQVPVAWLADRWGRSPVLIGCYLVALAGMSCLLVSFGTAWLAGWLFAAAACSGAFYPLGLALLGDRMPAGGLARANSWYLAINCIGSVTGPAVGGRVMHWFGNEALFLSGVVVVLAVLAVWLTLTVHRKRRSIEPAEPNCRLAA